MANILVVDDDSDINNIVQDILKDEGHETQAAFNLQTAKEALQKQSFDVIIVDIWLQANNMDGIGLLKTIMKIKPETPVIMISGHASSSVIKLALKLGAYDFIEKPFKSTRLLLVVRRAIDLANRIKISTAQDTTQQNDIIGTSLYAEKLRKHIKNLTKNSGRVLITGEIGTGKQYIAKIIHSMTNKIGKDYTTIDSANISHYIASNKIASMAQNINLGSIIIKNIDRFSKASQLHIKDVIQHTPHNAQNPRIICTAENINNIDSNLLSRININMVQLQPLRERKPDIPALMLSLITQYSAELEISSIPQIDHETMSTFLSHEWRGNMHELHIAAKGICINAKFYNKEYQPQNTISSCIKNSSSANLDAIMNEQYKIAKYDFEKNYILHQLDKFSGNITKTANFIDIDRSALHRRIKALGIEL